MAASEAKHVVGEARLLSFRDSRLVGSQERREAENHVATARECQQLDRKKRSNPCSTANGHNFGIYNSTVIPSWGDTFAETLETKSANNL